MHCPGTGLACLVGLLGFWVALQRWVPEHTACFFAEGSSLTGWEQLSPPSDKVFSLLNLDPVFTSIVISHLVSCNNFICYECLQEKTAHVLGMILCKMK